MKQKILSLIKKVKEISRKKTKNYWWNKIKYNSIILQYQETINFLDNKRNQTSKFRTKNWVEISDDSHGT